MVAANVTAPDRGAAHSSRFVAVPAAWWLWLAFYILVAMAMKASTFGDLNRHVDETFYFLVGQRMHEGLLPYVDVWDRKPLGLFLIYYLVAGISTSVLSYQIAACVFTGATACFIALTARRWSNPRGGLLAGLAYLLLLGPFEGNIGQAPDFYNLFVAAAAWLLAGDLDRLDRGRVGWRVWLAMILCGLAITIKQTTLFESLVFGFWILAALGRAGVPWPRIAIVAAICGAIGALPTLAIAAFYWQVGHWHEFWHAMVISNLAKGRVDGEAWRTVGILMRGWILIGCAVFGIWAHPARRQRAFLIAWIAAALIGFLSVPNFYGHYFLPVLVPLSVAAGLAFARASGRVIFIAYLCYALMWSTFWDVESTRESKRTMTEAARLILAHDAGRGLLVYDGTHYLYALTGKPFLSPLVFAQHLNHEVERNVSHLDTNAEIDRILARQPGVIVMTRYPTYKPVNRYTRGRVLDYVRSRCRLVGQIQISSNFAYNPHMIFGDCRSTESGGDGGRRKD